MTKEKKKNVVSVRLDDESLLKLQSIQDLLGEKIGLETSYSVTFEAMINLYHKFLTELDKEVIDKYIMNIMIELAKKDN